MVLPLAGPILSAFGGGQGGLNSQEAIRALRRIYFGTQTQTRNLFGEARAGLDSSIEDIRDAYNLAREDIGRGAEVARRNALDTSRQSQAASTLDLQARGLGASTRAGSERASITDRYNREIAEIESRIGQLYAGLRTSEARDVSSVRSNLASLFGAQAGAEAGLASQLMGIYGQTDEQQSDLFGTLLSTGLQIAALFPAG